MDAIRFNQKMFGLSNRVGFNANQIVKDVAAKCVAELIDRTPIDKGRAVSNWRVGLNYEPRGEIDAHLPGHLGSTSGVNRSTTKSIALSHISARVTGQTIYIVNNVRYMVYLNQGWSDQAPAGFVDHAVHTANAELRAARLLRNA